MTQDDIKRRIFQNSISNYVFLVVRSVLGLVLFRAIVTSLGKEEFGFWSLIWSILGYGILLDFGFGFTAQKRVAELTAHQRWDELSRVLSTVFYFYLGIAAVLILFGLGMSPWVIKAFKISNPANLPEFTSALTIFFCGMGLAFPMGIFPEMLKGQQRIGLANYTALGGFLVSFVLMLYGLHNDWSLQALLVISLGCSMAAEALCGVFALRAMPGVRILPRYFSRAMIRSNMRFSLFAYIITLTTVILTRTDQFILGTMLAVQAVGLYNIGAKLPELFASVAMQIPETLSPVAAHSHAKGDKEFLRSVLVNGTRFSVMVATPLYLLFAFYMEELIRLATGQPVPRESLWTAQVLLLWGYITILTQSVSKRVFMMSGHERRLMWLGVGEAMLNLGLSVALLYYFRNVVSVAIGSFIATFIFGWFAIWPWAAREASLTGWKLAQIVLLPSWLACLPMLALLIVARYVTFPHLQTNIYALAIQGILVSVLASAGLWFFALRPHERERFGAAFLRVFGKGTPA
jgi:O-antigen/teichoic acid export membrane protein